MCAGVYMCVYLPGYYFPVKVAIFRTRYFSTCVFTCFFLLLLLFLPVAYFT